MFLLLTLINTNSSNIQAQELIFDLCFLFILPEGYIVYFKYTQFHPYISPQ